MSGTSETFEISHLDGLSEKHAKAVRLLLNHYELNQLMAFYKQGTQPKECHGLPKLPDAEWRSLLPKIIFCKITAFELNAYYSQAQLHYLIELLSFCLKTMGQSNKLMVEVDDLPADYLIAQNWLKKAYGFYQAKKKS